MKTISLKLPEGLRAMLDRAAERGKRTRSQLVREAIEAYLNGPRSASPPGSALDLAGDLVGCAEGPGDLAAHPKYMRDFGS